MSSGGAWRATVLACLALGLGRPVARAAETATPRVDHHQHLFSPATRSLSPAVRAVDAADMIRFLDEGSIEYMR